VGGGRKGRQGIRGGRHRLRQRRYAVTRHSSQGQTADRVLIHTDTELEAKKPAQQPDGLRCRPARRIRRANGPLSLFLHGGQNNQRKDFQTFPRCASACCFASSRCGW
jgi:hypothetical protein